MFSDNSLNMKSPFFPRFFPFCRVEVLTFTVTLFLAPMAFLDPELLENKAGSVSDSGQPLLLDLLPLDKSSYSRKDYLVHLL